MDNSSATIVKSENTTSSLTQMINYENPDPSTNQTPPVAIRKAYSNSLWKFFINLDLSRNPPVATRKGYSNSLWKFIINLDLSRKSSGILIQKKIEINEDSVNSNFTQLLNSSEVFIGQNKKATLNFNLYKPTGYCLIWRNFLTKEKKHVEKKISKKWLGSC